MEDPKTACDEMEVERLGELKPSLLELLERQTTAFLYALWRARGVNKRIVKIRSGEET